MRSVCWRPRVGPPQRAGQHAPAEAHRSPSRRDEPGDPRPHAAVVARAAGRRRLRRGVRVVRWASGLVGPDVQDLVLAVLFFICLLVGLGARALLQRAGVRLDGAALRTVTVWAVDGLTMAILGSLAWDDVSGVVGPLVAVLGLAVVATGAAIWAMGRRLPTQRLERQLALFGTVTGTAASGLALIAMVDPEMESSAATELGAPRGRLDPGRARRDRPDLTDRHRDAVAADHDRDPVGRGRRRGAGAAHDRPAAAWQPRSAHTRMR